DQVEARQRRGARREAELGAALWRGLLLDRDRAREDDRVFLERAVLVAARAVQVEQARVVRRTGDRDGRVVQAPVLARGDVAAPGQDRIRDVGREGDGDAGFLVA